MYNVYSTSIQLLRGGAPPPQSKQELCLFSNGLSLLTSAFKFILHEKQFDKHDN